MRSPPPTGRRGRLPVRERCELGAGSPSPSRSGRPPRPRRAGRRAPRGASSAARPARRDQPVRRALRQAQPRRDRVRRRPRSAGSKAASRRIGSRRDARRALAPRPARRAGRPPTISGRTGCKMPRSIISRTVGAGSGKAEQLQQLVGDPLARQRHQVVGARRAGVERRRRRASPAPKRAWKRKKRRIRRWSSAMRCSGSPMKRTRRASRSARPPK